MGETADQTRREIEQTRQHMTDTINRLESEVRSVLDWRARVRARPWMYVGIAVATGFVLAGGPWRATGHAVRAIRRSRQTPLQRLGEAAGARLDQVSEAVQSQVSGAVAQWPVTATVDQRPQGNIVRTSVKVGRSPVWEKFALRSVDSAAGTVAAILTNRVLQEMRGSDAKR